MDSRRDLPSDEEEDDDNRAMAGGKSKSKNHRTCQPAGLTWTDPATYIRYGRRDGYQTCCTKTHIGLCQCPKADLALPRSRLPQEGSTHVRTHTYTFTRKGCLPVDGPVETAVGGGQLNRQRMGNISAPVSSCATLASSCVSEPFCLRLVCRLPACWPSFLAPLPPHPCYWHERKPERQRSN